MPEMTLTLTHPDGTSTPVTLTYSVVNLSELPPTPEEASADGYAKAATHLAASGTAETTPALLPPGTRVKVRNIPGGPDVGEGLVAVIEGGAYRRMGGGSRWDGRWGSDGAARLRFESPPVPPLQEPWAWGCVELEVLPPKAVMAEKPVPAKEPPLPLPVPIPPVGARVRILEIHPESISSIQQRNLVGAEAIVETQLERNTFYGPSWFRGCLRMQGEAVPVGLLAVRVAVVEAPTPPEPAPVADVAFGVAPDVDPLPVSTTPAPPSEDERAAWALSAAFPVTASFVKEALLEDLMSDKKPDPTPAPAPPSDPLSLAAQALQEGGEAARRIAGAQLSKTAREPVAALLARGLGDDSPEFRARLSRFLSTELGTAVADALVGLGLSLTPSPFARDMAKEMRVRALAGGGGVVADALLDPLREVASTFLRGTEESAPALPAESTMGARLRDTLNGTVEAEDPAPVGAERRVR